MTFFVIWASLIFMVGAAIGSFLNVCIARWPANLSVVAPRSRCPRCERPIAWYENIPLVSWVALRARCRGCHLPISIQYPAVELGVALGWLIAFIAYPDPLTALRVAVFGTVLAGIAVTDLQHYVIPDGFTVFGLLWVVGTSFASFFMLRGSTPFVDPYAAVLGACVGAGAISIIGWLGEVVLKREAMGFGDVTLMAVVGAAVGPVGALLTIFIGAGLGALTFAGVVLPIGWLRSRRNGTPFAAPLVPFGVFLAPAALVTLLSGHAMIDWYTSRLQ
ncbi:MAG TPA: prepilin peptidase [Gemmatimonadaceae bacterium]|jgi:leader peptidase (prepilin peptidase)/N-methyltransferase|nr:prepilin peptidase [Gemmatimonadaceae bacterium]